MRGLLRACLQSFREAWDGLRRNVPMSALCALSTGVSLYVLGLFLLIAFNLNLLLGALGQELQVQIYLSASASASDIDSLREALAADPAIAEVRFVSVPEARRRFRENFPALGDLPETIGEDVFPPSFELIPREGHRTPAEVERLARKYEKAAGVDEVRYDLGWVRRMAGMVGLVRRGAYTLGGLLLGAVMVTVAAVVRLSVLARRDEIAIMRLVGATAAFVRVPFLLGAAAQGLVGGGLAVGALWASHQLLQRSAVFSQNPFMPMIVGRFLPAEGVAGLAVAGALLAFLAALLALRRAGSV